MLRTAGTAVGLAMVAALGNILTELRTKHEKAWGPWHEVAFMIITNALFGPLGSMGASVAAKAAVGLAMRGAVKAAWTAASINSSKMVGALTTMSKGVRTALAHRGTTLPADQLEFVKHLQDQVPGFTEDLMQGVAAQQLDHRGMLELYARLLDPEISGAQIEKRVHTLLGQFDSNRIGSIGNVMDLAGGYEVAKPLRVRARE